MPTYNSQFEELQQKFFEHTGITWEKDIGLYCQYVQAQCLAVIMDSIIGIEKEISDIKDSLNREE
jgi:hypothetical protein